MLHFAVLLPKTPNLKQDKNYIILYIYIYVCSLDDSILRQRFI